MSVADPEMKTYGVIASIAICSSLGACSTELGDDNGDTNPDIIGGSATSGFPEVGMVGVTGPAILCTGFLVSPTIVVTAAHCIEGGEAYGFYTGTGALETVADPTEAVLDALPNTTKHAVLESAMYPGANLSVSPYEYDVAYVRLAAPLTATPEQIAAPAAVDTTCQAVGFGWTSTSSPTGLLKKTGTEIVTTVDGFDSDVSEASAIADRGDSGSPLICNGVTVGTFSWIDNYSSTSALRRYARLDGAVGTWIDNIVNPPPPPTFTAGDPFDYSVVTPQSQMVATMLTGFGYAASASPKSVAINADGLGFVSIQPTGTQADADLIALQACYVIGGGKPCASLASADVFDVGSTTLAASFNFTLATPTTLAQMPYVSGSNRTAAITAYDAITGTKAIAISLDGTVTEINNTDVIASQAEADRIVMERCEMTAQLTPCTLFAEGTAVVFAPSWTPQINYAQRTVATELPGATAANYNAHIPAYLAGVAGGDPGYIYIAADGDGGDAWETTAAAAASTALGYCNEFVGAGFKCFPYATNDTITFGPANLVGYADKAVHCDSMPRASCAAHSSMGCTGGSYYIAQAGSVTLETCP
jgi:Trypsin